MALSDQDKNFVKAGIANPQASEEVLRLLQLIEDLEARVEALENP
jgi:hypothetical protein